MRMPRPTTSCVRAKLFPSSPRRVERDACANRRRGPPHKPLPRKKIPADLRSLARGHTALCIKVLAGIAQNGESESARVAAANILLDRGWGKPPTTHTGPD